MQGILNLDPTTPPFALFLYSHYEGRHYSRKFNNSRLLLDLTMNIARNMTDNYKKIGQQSGFKLQSTFWMGVFFLDTLLHEVN